VAVGDFNQDGILDLVVANNGSYPFYTDGDVSVLLGNGDGSFQAPLSYHAGESPYAVVVDDFNGDGFPDVATANWNSNNVTVLLNAVDWSAPATSTTAPVSMSALGGDSANAVGSRAFVFIPSTAEVPLTRTGALTREDPNLGRISTPAPGADRGLGLSRLSRASVATETWWLDDLVLEEQGFG